MKKGKYEKLREQYPEYVNMEQLYRICGIAKRSAKYLLDHGIIPCQDTGKKTWRYRIAIVDVIIYLRQREQWGSMIPKNAVSSRPNPSSRLRQSYASMMQNGDERLLTEYFAYIYADFPDVVTTAEVCEMTGLSKKTILTFIKTGGLSSMLIGGKHHIPKATLLDYMCGKSFLETQSNSEQFTKILGGFELWKTAKS